MKLSIIRNSVGKNCFISARRCSDDIVSLIEMDEKIIFGGTIGYGDSYLAFNFLSLQKI